MSADKRIRVVYNGSGMRVTIEPAWSTADFLNYLRPKLNIPAEAEVRGCVRCV